MPFVNTVSLQFEIFADIFRFAVKMFNGLHLFVPGHSLDPAVKLDRRLETGTDQGIIMH